MLRGASSRFEHRVDPPRHAVDQISDLSLGHPEPFFLEGGSQLNKIRRLDWSSVDSPAKQAPGVLNRVEIWTPRGPRDAPDSKPPLLLLHGSSTMSWCVVLLQFPVAVRLPEIGSGPRQKVVSEDSLVGLLVDVLPEDHQLRPAACVDRSPDVHRSATVGDCLD